MKKNLTILITAVALVAALIASPLSAQQRTRYKLIDMGTFGGPASEVNNGNNGSFSVTVLNNRGELVGWGETPPPDPFAPACLDEKCLVVHAFQWRNGATTDLGTLPGGSSSQANWISQSGLIAGISENGQTDPRVPGFPQTHGVLWRNGHITDLGTLEGGYESFANGVNGAGQVVGGALNTVPDGQNSLAAPGLFPTQTRAFLWQDGKMQDLGTLGGPDALAQFINESGKVVGWSYTSDSPNTSCPPTPDGGGFPLSIGSFIWDGKNKMRNLGTFGGDCTIATGVNNQGTVVGFSVNNDGFQRAFLWEDGSMKDLGGTIGGEQAGAEAINESGQVVGVATLAGKVFFHATLWRQVGEITDLGVLGQDSCSLASSINSTVQIVGTSSANCNFDNNTSAVLWEDGQISDLNALIPSGASLHLQWAETINDRGEIAGTGLDANENLHVFLLIPCDANDTTDCQEVVAGASETPRDSPALVTQGPQAANPSHSIGQMLSSPQTSTLSSAALNGGITITSGLPPEGTVGKPYGPLQVLIRCGFVGECPVYYFQLSASGGSGNYSWSWAAAPGSSLPPGLGCCSLFMTGSWPNPFAFHWYHPVIYGRPTEAGTYNVIVTVTDSSSPALHASATYSITVLQ